MTEIVDPLRPAASDPSASHPDAATGATGREGVRIDRFRPSALPGIDDGVHDLLRGSESIFILP